MLQNILFKAINKLPAILKTPIQAIPFSIYQKPLQYALSQLLFEQLEEGELDFLEERFLQIQVTDLNFNFAITVENENLIILPPMPNPCVVFSGNSPDLLLIAARKQDPDTLFFRRKLSITGDTELGLAVKNLMDSIDWQQMPRLITIFLEQVANLIEKAQSHEQALQK